MDKLINSLQQMSVFEVENKARKMKLEKLTDLVGELNERYETGDTGLSDSRFDVLDEVLKDRANIDAEKDFVGTGEDSGVAGDEKTKLPFFMGSASKIKPTDEKKLENWLKKNKSPQGYALSGKLDGISCLAVYKKGSQPLLYTRGRKGTHGRDISFLVEKVPSIPNTLEVDIVVRGELVMPKKTFERKYKNDYENARAIVQGLVGSKKQGVKDLHFVSYEVLRDKNAPRPEEQFAILDELGFEVVEHEIVDELNIQLLSEKIVQYKSQSPYLLDGIILQSNKPVNRTSKKYPDYMFAFKIDGDPVEVEVEEIQWNIGKWKTLAPRIRYKRTKIDNCWNEYATAHTANHVYKDKLGPGAVINIVRSGDITPQYVSVVKPAKKPSMPENLTWHWDSNHTHIIADDSEEVNRLACIKRIRMFMKNLEVNEFGPARIELLYDNGMNTLIKVLSGTEEDFVRCVKSQAIGSKMYKNISLLLTNPNIPEIVGASGILGEKIGREMSEKLVDGIPNIFKLGLNPSEQLRKKILSLPGFGCITGEMVFKNIYWASMFARLVEGISTKSTEKKSNIEVVGDRFKGMTFVVTGFTQKSSAEAKEILDTITSNGGSWTTKWSKGVSGVIASNKSLEKGSNKIDKAESLNIPVYDLDTFLETVQ